MELAADGGAVTAEVTSDLGLVETLLSQRGENLPFCGGELAILHDGFPFLGGNEKRRVFQFASLWGIDVALSL